MHLLILFVFLGLAVLIVWLADWTSGITRTPTAIDILNRRLARGEIDRAEYDEKLKLIWRSPHWVKVKNPNAPAVKREAEEDWGR